MIEEQKRQGEGPEGRATGNTGLDLEGFRDRDAPVTEDHMSVPPRGRPPLKYHKRRKLDLLG